MNMGFLKERKIWQVKLRRKFMRSWGCSGGSRGRGGGCCEGLKRFKRNKRFKGTLKRMVEDHEQAMLQRSSESNGGERGIRTLETLLGFTRFRVARLRPLGHLSRRVRIIHMKGFGERNSICISFVIMNQSLFFPSSYLSNPALKQRM